MPLCWGNKYSGLRLHLGGLFLRWVSNLSPGLLIDFSLESILLDIRMATPSCFLGPFDWKIFSQPFTLSLCLSLKLRCVSCMQQDGFCFCIHRVSVCLFIGELSPLILRDINDQ